MPVSIIEPDPFSEVQQHDARAIADAHVIAWCSESPRTRPATKSKVIRIRSRYYHFVYFACLLIIGGALLRVWNLHRVPGINGDEAWYGVQAQLFIDQYILCKELPLEEQITFRTPTGNFWNPFFMGPRNLLELFGEPSFWKLRLPAAIFGLLTLVVNWRLCRRSFGRQMAWNTTLALAVLPVMIAYSRIAWDACQSVLFCLPVIYWPIEARRRGLQVVRKNLKTIFLSGFMLGCAVVVHPTNILIAPVWLCLIWPLGISIAPALKVQSRFLFATVVVLVMGIVFSIGLYRQPQMTVIEFVAATLHPEAINTAICDMASLFSGRQVYFSMSLNDNGDWRCVALKFFIFALILPTILMIIRTAIRYWPQRKSKFSVYCPALFCDLISGMFLSTICLLLLGGPNALQTGYERYGLWCVAPCVLIAAMAIQQLQNRQWLRVVQFQVVAMLACYAILFQANLETTGGQGHATYQTANIEPKQQLLQDAMTKADGNAMPTIILNDKNPWWNYWPLRYLSHERATIIK